jgi:hypothetical protein
MFAFSSAFTRGFAVYYKSDPLLRFHLAAAFDTGGTGPEIIYQIV